MSVDRYKQFHDKGDFLQPFTDVFSIMIIDRSHTIIDANEKTFEITGITREELIGGNCCELFHNCKIPVNNCPLEEAMKKGKACGYRMPVEAFNKIFFVEVFPLPGKEKELFVHLAYDLTDILAKEEIYETLFHSIRDAIIVANTKREIINCNEEFTRLFGYSLNEIEGKQTLVIYENEAEYLELGKNLKKNQGSSFVFPVNYKRKDGTVFTGETKVSYIKNNQGEVTGFMGYIRDISESLSIRKELEFSEEKFRKAFVTSPDSININRLKDGIYIDINDGFTAIMGYTKEDAIGKTSIELNIWANNKDRDSLVKLLKMQGMVKAFETDFRKKDGSLVRGLMSANIIRLNNEPHILSITKDISEQKRNQLEIEESHNKLLKAEEIAQIGFLDWNLENNHIELSDEVIRLYQADPDKKYQTAEFIEQVVHPEDRGFVEKSLEMAIQGRKPYNIDHRIKRRDGSVIWVHAVAELYHDNKGKPFRLLGVIQDITDRKKTETELKKYCHHLEDLVKDRTLELQENNKELERLNNLFVGREFRIKELRDKVAALEEQLKGK